MDTPLLWHIPLSHFNEKARWALDYKGIAHRRQVLGPDYLVRAWRATGQGKLPILFLDDQAVSDSTRIIAARSRSAIRNRCFILVSRPCVNGHSNSKTTSTRRSARHWRASIITPIFRQDRDLALRILTTGMPEAADRRLRSVARIFPVFYRFRHKISDRRLENDRAAVGAALDRIERERDGRAYLVGASFTVADLTAASLLSPLLQPPEIQYPLRVELPPDIQDYRAALLRHPAAQWALPAAPRRFDGSQTKGSGVDFAIAEPPARPLGARNHPRLDGGRSVLNAPGHPSSFDPVFDDWRRE